jgi:glycosyltransferase involved in cell wall biosynthesis
MNILYLGYWNLNDPLTHSTVFPNLSVLSSFPWIKRIVFVNVERDVREDHSLPFTNDKIIYKPFISSRRSNVFSEKFNDFIKAPVFLRNLIIQFQIDAIIARGAPAGGLAWLVWRKTRIPFYVESFEPHGQYMVDSQVWRQYDPRNLIEAKLEQMQIRNASGLMPVALAYTRELEKMGVDPLRIKTVPCIVETERFQFSNESRKVIRQQLGIKSNQVVGVYAGRYGGLYLEEDAFRLYKKAFEYFGPEFHLILLTPEVYHTWIREQLTRFDLPIDRIHIQSVSHDEVPLFLSAGDFAFATYKPGKAMAYLSPVKIGEYWASGLPVILTEGVGDETDIIRKHPDAGVLFKPSELNSLGEEFKRLQILIRKGRSITKVVELAETYRNPRFVVEAYEYFLKPKSV